MLKFLLRESKVKGRNKDSNSLSLRSLHHFILMPSTAFKSKSIQDQSFRALSKLIFILSLKKAIKKVKTSYILRRTSSGPSRRLLKIVRSPESAGFIRSPEDLSVGPSVINRSSPESGGFLSVGLSIWK